MKRLLVAGKPRTDNSGDASEEKDVVLLFIRIEGDRYTCCGRVEYVAVDVNVSPIVIKWKLVDYKLLIEKPYYQDILKSGKCTI